MKFLKLSLAASVALGAFSTASFAQPLEEAIKGVDVSGFLRYRYNDDRFDDGTEGGATHRWRAQADFKTPVVNNVALNLGVLYNNEDQNVNHGKSGIGTGSGLGAGKDGNDKDFGVSTFYATITPDSTATTVIIGKQRLGTPVTDPLDDRGTGILALNSDITGLTLAAGAFDSWSLDDLQPGYGPTDTLRNPNGDSSVDKPLYTLAAIYGVDTAYGNIGAQAWGFIVDDIVDASAFLELAYKGSLLNAKLQYAFAKLNNGEGSIIQALAGNPNNPERRGLPQANDVLSFQIGADFTNNYSIPLDVKLGYITNFQDGVVALFDDEGALAKAGKIWWQNETTGVTFGLGKALGQFYGVNSDIYGHETTLNVFYGAVSYGLVDNRLRVGLEGVYGKNTIDNPRNNLSDRKVDFTEITPTISWQHNQNLNISAFYAMLSTNDKHKTATSNNDEDRNRARVEVKYSF
ncbi:major outer membrane protein [Helicobacter turcicus]|uniref:Major outer membrane protein n=1 Tax=Helicobacter turcicus TaxID=2867412 RepID=A0ABS7JNE0_9HELI|nr:major outer membrane protein [Helicobacter turcicus]MBX7490892.1 major outer membrane protein [Helicobacter turcicus]MBX7545746.1 major outer membrane protein [Helicobacter turcicus]